MRGWAIGALAVCAVMLGGLSNDVPYCQANTSDGQADYRELRAYLSIHYPERLVRQIDVIPRCPKCMHSVRTFVIEAYYKGSDRPVSQNWSRIEEIRHLNLVADGTIVRFRIRYTGDDCDCCDHPAHSAAAWIDKTDLYAPPEDLWTLPLPDRPDRLPHPPPPPPWRQAHASCPACEASAEARNVQAKAVFDLQSHLADATYRRAVADYETRRWAEWIGTLETIPSIPQNSAALAKALSNARAGQNAADALSTRLIAEEISLKDQIVAAQAKLAAEDAALADCESRECRVGRAPPPPAGVCKTGELLPPTQLGRAVIDQLNFARTQPVAYAQTLKTYRGYFRGTLVKEPGAPLAATNEGVAAVDEAIAFLERQAPMPALAVSPALTDAATRFAREAGAAGLMGHVGADGKGLSERLKVDCFVAGYVSEIIAYRQAVAVAIVRQLLIDDGLRARLHRSDMFSTVAKVAGASCAQHATQGTLCVIDLAGAVMAEPTPAVESANRRESGRGAS